MSTPGLIFIIGGIISAIIACCWFYNTGGKEQQLKVIDLLAFVWIATFAFLISWVGVVASIFIKYGNVVIINKKVKRNKQ